MNAASTRAIDDHADQHGECDPRADLKQPTRPLRAVADQMPTQMSVAPAASNTGIATNPSAIPPDTARCPRVLVISTTNKIASTIAAPPAAYAIHDATIMTTDPRSEPDP